MALDTLQKVLDGLPGRAIPARKTFAASGTGGPRLYSLWSSGPFPTAGATPPTGSGEAPGQSTTGALKFAAAGAGKSLYLADYIIDSTVANLAIGIYDRLVHTSGLVGNVTTEQVIDTAALTRNTSGEGVELWIETYTNSPIPNATSVTVNYTNQDGTTGRTTTFAATGGNGTAGGILTVPLASGDTGVRAVHSVTLGASSGVAGSFGVTLVRRIAECWNNISGLNGAGREDWSDLGLPVIDADACLAFWCPFLGFGGTADFYGLTTLIEA